MMMERARRSADSKMMQSVVNCDGVRMGTSRLSTASFVKTIPYRKECSIASRLSEMGILVAVANNEPYRVIVKLDGYPIKEEVLHILSDSVLCSNRGTWTVKDWALGGHSMVSSS